VVQEKQIATARRAAASGLWEAVVNPGGARAFGRRLFLRAIHQFGQEER
jgi:hypothetical protein